MTRTVTLRSATLASMLGGFSAVIGSTVYDWQQGEAPDTKTMFLLAAGFIVGSISTFALGSPVTRCNHHQGRISPRDPA
jgi:hypothetical protein